MTDTEEQFGENSHIFQYIKYYSDLSAPPQYAVMILGPWGIGKTYWMNKITQALRSSSKKIVNVSLHGLKSTDDVDLAILLASHPALESDVGKYGATIGKAVLKYFGVHSLIQAGDVLKKVEIDLLVFDDLERCKLPADEILGYINQHVEHEGRKVVVLANEDEIDNADKYRKIREKVIGQTFQLQRNDDKALTDFIASVDDQGARELLTVNRDEILSIFQQSATNNLRILKQTISSWARFHKQIDDTHKEKPYGMSVVLNLFVVFSLELRVSRLLPEDLENRVDKIVAGQIARHAGGETTPTRLSEADRRYPEIHLHDNVLSDAVLRSTLCEGRVDRDAINRCLSRSQYFIRANDEPAWQVVWYAITRDEAEVETAIEKMEQQFKDREFVNSGEILHVFGLRLWCSKIQQLNLDAQKVADECMAYVDELVANDRILEGSRDEILEYPIASSNGMVFNKGDEQVFDQLRDYYISNLEQAMRNQWPNLARETIDVMKNDVMEFFRLVSWTNDDRENKYAYVPIFSSIAATEFVEAVLHLKPKDQRTALTALQGRYDGFKLSNDLAGERQWLTDVRDELLTRAEQLGPIRQHAIKNEVARLLEPALTAA